MTTAPATRAERRWADLAAGKTVSWSFDIYGTGRRRLSLTKNADGTFQLEQIESDMGGEDLTYNTTILEPEVRQRLADAENDT